MTGTRRPSRPNTRPRSPNVVAVGGTTLLVNGSSPNYTYGSETAWGDGTSSGTAAAAAAASVLYESQPSYQNGVVAKYNSSISTTMRDYPDVSADADPNSGVPIYDSYDFGTSPVAAVWRHQPCLPAVGRDDRRRRRRTGDCRPGIARRSEPDPAGIVQNARGGHPRHHSAAVTAPPRRMPGPGYDLAIGARQPGRQPASFPNWPGPASSSARRPRPGGKPPIFAVLGADSGGESTLTYTWAATSCPAGLRRRLSASTAATRRRTPRPPSPRRGPTSSR